MPVMKLRVYWLILILLTCHSVSQLIFKESSDVYSKFAKSNYTVYGPSHAEEKLSKNILIQPIISVLVVSSEVLQLFAGILTCSTKSGPMAEEMTYWRNNKLVSGCLGLVCILLCYYLLESSEWRKFAITLRLLVHVACCHLDMWLSKKFINLNLCLCFSFEHWGWITLNSRAYLSEITRGAKALSSLYLFLSWVLRCSNCLLGFQHIALIALLLPF